MIFLIRNIPISIHLLVLVLCIVLRLPAFLPDYFLPDESLYMLIAQKLVDGGTLYVDAWFGGPPLMVWIYKAFAMVFGKGALTALRVCTVIYIYLTSVFILGMLVEYKVFKKDQPAAAVILVLLVSIPWYSLEFSPTLFLLWPVAYAFHAIIQLTVGTKHNFRRLFTSGFILFVCFLAFYPAISLFLGVTVAYFLIRQPRLDEFFTFLLGTGLGLISFVLTIYFTGSTLEFWDIGIRSYSTGSVGEGTDGGSFFALGAILMYWGIFILLAIPGFVHFRLKYFSYVTIIRRAERVMSIWLVCGTLVLISQWRHLHLSDFIIIAPPFAFYAAKVWYFRFRPLMRTLMWVGFMGIMGLGALNLGAARWPDTFSFMSFSSKYPVLSGYSFLKEEALKSRFSGEIQSHSIWIPGNQPNLYLYLGMPCATRYTDFRVVLKKFSYYADPSQAPHRYEPDSEIYEQFRKDPPDFILDQANRFGRLQERFPSLFEGYQTEKSGAHLIWEK